MATRVDQVVLPQVAAREAAVVSLPLPGHHQALHWPHPWLNDRTRGMYFLNRQSGLGHQRAHFRAITEHWISTTVQFEAVIATAGSWHQLKLAADRLLYEPKAHHSAWWHLGYQLAALRPRYVWNDRRRSHDEAIAEFKSIWGGG